MELARVDHPGSDSGVSCAKAMFSIGRDAKARLTIAVCEP